MVGGDWQDLAGGLCGKAELAKDAIMDGRLMLTTYQQELRDRFLSAPVMPAPEPWRLVGGRPTLVGGLVGIGFAIDPVSGHDLVMTVTHSGHGLFDATNGDRIARDQDPDAGSSMPDATDLSCPGLGPVAGTRIPIAGLFGGGLHTTTTDGWTIQVVSPEWPNDRVLLSSDGGLCQGPAGQNWWHIFHADHSELRAAGFSPSGQTLAVATTSDLTLWARSGSPDQSGSCPDQRPETVAR